MEWDIIDTIASRDAAMSGPKERVEAVVRIASGMASNV